MTIRQKLVLGAPNPWTMLDEAAAIARDRRCVIITGTSFSASVARDFLANHAGLHVEFIEITADLPTADAYDVVWHRACEGETPGVIVAVGGGKVLDLAKLVSLWAGTHQELLLHVRRAEDTTGKIPLLAVPTTFGSGAEATPFSVLYVGGSKKSVDVPRLLPEVAVLDHRFCQSASRNVKIAAGLDAVCQGIESLLSKRRCAESEQLAVRSLMLSCSALPGAIDGDDVAERRMVRAANLAGRAIAITRTTVPHALSYLLSSKYGVPHGLAVATTMSPYLRWLQEQEAAKSTLSSFGHGRPLEKWEGLVSSVDSTLRGRFDELRRLHGAEMVEAVNMERLSNAMVPITPGDLSAMMGGG
ncbi:iron-containing alcohol dehydrogenase [Roseibium sp. AS2]|uniref:iron-containing alcohol dehydrogenase n=1 Tax=Roseibium sp. AS2 TaxID=3135781 RepID=UPI0031733B2A